MKIIKEQAEAAAKEWRLANEELLYPHYSPNEIEAMEQGFSKGFEKAQGAADNDKGTDWPVEGVAGQHGWISVDDERKPKRGDVLTYHEANFYNIVWTSGNGKLPLSATHWRYLPESPNQQTNE